MATNTIPQPQEGQAQNPITEEPVVQQSYNPNNKTQLENRLREMNKQANDTATTAPQNVNDQLIQNGLSAKKIVEEGADNVVKTELDQQNREWATQGEPQPKPTNEELGIVPPKDVTPEEETPDPNVDKWTNDARSKARGGVYAEMEKRWRKHGEGAYMHDGDMFVMLNGVPKPLVDAFGNVLDTDGVYKKVNDDGSLSDAEQTEDNNELLHNMFDYFDAHNGDVKSVNDPDFLITEAGGAIGGTASMRELAEQLNVDTNTFGWKRRLLQAVKDAYTNQKANRKKYFDEFDRANIPEADEDLHLKLDNGEDSVIPKDAINEFFNKCKEFHTTQKDYPAMYKRGQGYVKNFQQYMHDFMEKYPAAKEAVQKGINWTGANGLKFPVDADYGQNTTSVMWNILALMGGDDALKMVGAKYDPDTDRIEADNDGIDPVNEWYARQGLESQERHEEKRNDRMKVFNNMAELVSGIGDIVGGSQGVEIKDRAEEIGKEADALENRRTEIKKEFDAKMIDLKDKQQKARTEKQKQRYELMMAREKMKFEHDEAKLNREWQSNEKQQDRLLQEAMQKRELAVKKEIAAAANETSKWVAQYKGSGNTLKLNNEVCSLNGKSLLCPQGFENSYISRVGNMLKAVALNADGYGFNSEDANDLDVLIGKLNPQSSSASVEERRNIINDISERYAEKYPEFGKALGNIVDQMNQNLIETVKGSGGATSNESGDTTEGHGFADD